ncbi:MAG: hypothetical protein FJ029_04205 [Actinobacteria bacterium]|nr:hypothetical protein [Actinomycetota bacterium]
MPAALTNATWKVRGDATAPKSAVWNPIVGQVAEVTTAGDLALIDARGTSANFIVTVSLLNIVALSGDYS